MKTRMIPAAVVTGVLLLTGCASNDQSGDAAPEQATGRAPAAGSDAGYGAARNSTGADAGGDAGSDGTDSAGTTGTTELPAPSGRDIIYTADLRVRAGNVNQAAARAKQQVAAAGGHVADEQSSSEPGVPATVALTFKIPAARYQATLDQLAGHLGTRLSLRQQAEDVTQQVADVDSRVSSAKAALSSYRRLLSRADTIGDVLSVEKEITQRESDLEALQARQRTLADQAALATVALRLESPEAAAESEPETGFLSGLKSGWKALVEVGEGLATLVGWLLPFLVPGAVVAVAGRRIARTVRTRRRAQTGSGDAPPAAPAG